MGFNRQFVVIHQLGMGVLVDHGELHLQDVLVFDIGIENMIVASTWMDGPERSHHEWWAVPRVVVLKRVCLAASLPCNRHARPLEGFRPCNGTLNPESHPSGKASCSAQG